MMVTDHFSLRKCKKIKTKNKNLVCSTCCSRRLLEVGLGTQLLEAELGGAAEQQLFTVHALLLDFPRLGLFVLLVLLLQPLERSLLSAGLTRRQHCVHHWVDLTRRPGGREGRS